MSYSAIRGNERRLALVSVLNKPPSKGDRYGNSFDYRFNA
jgi:hypothetical protein